MSKASLTIGIVAVVAIVVVAYFFYFSGGNPLQQGASFSNIDSNMAPGSVVIQEVKQGSGAEATLGANVQVSYVGKLQNGTVFDQSSNHGGPFSFMLGGGQVIPGWEQGVQGMKVGGERILIIPPSLAYGSQDLTDSTGHVVIPGNSTLIFDVQLVGVSTSTVVAPEGPSAE